MNIGQLIDALERLPNKDEIAYVDTPLGWLYAVYFCSYRGFYDQLALVVTDDYSNMPMSELLTKAKECVGKDFCGYKGGSYTMTRETNVWVVLGYSSVSELAVTGVEDSDAPRVLTGAPPY